MKATLYSNTSVLGTIDMKIIDESMGVVGGILTPNKAYIRLQSTFRESKGVYTEAVQQLNINVQLENGCYLQPVAGYSFTDDPEFPEEIEVHVVGSNYFMIFENIEDNLPIEFVEEPWYSLTIDTKLALERELRYELSLFREEKRFNNHPFAKTEFYALSNYGPNDDVLFYAVGINSCQFAVIHLTWTGNPEGEPNYPRTVYYDSFLEFKENRMIPDVKEFN